MRTARQIEASRLNGARSRGPITAAGKRRSSGNSHRHGLYSRNVESTAIPEYLTEATATFRAQIEAEYNSDRLINPALDPLIQNVIRAHGLFWRIVFLETTVMTEEIAHQRRKHPEKSETSLQALAFRRLTDETGTLELIGRFEARFFRQYQLAISNLDRARLRRPEPLELAIEHEFAETNPAAPSEQTTHAIPEKSESAETNPRKPGAKSKNAGTNPTPKPNAPSHHRPNCAPRQTSPTKIDIIETEPSRTDPAQAEMTTRLLILIAATTSAGLTQPNTPKYRADLGRGAVQEAGARPGLRDVIFGSAKGAVLAAGTRPVLRDVINQYCITCHNEKTKTAGLALDKIDLTRIPADAEIWEKVIRKVRVGMMPPQSAPHPDPATRQAFVAALQTTLDKAAAAHPDPGRPLVHRLNRAEYASAIRDLLALEVDPTTLLPPDDSGYGFDNIADALGVSPVLLERYLSAAGKISALAVGDPNIGAAGETFRVPQDASQDVHIEGLPIGTVGGLLAKTTLPLDGEYVLTTTLFRTNLGATRGLEYPHQFEITVDGERAHLASFGGDADFKASLANITEAGNAIEHRFMARLKLKAGPHQITAAFLERSATQNTYRLQPFLRSSNDTIDPSGNPHILTFTITGPFSPTGPGDTPSRRKIFVCDCPKQILTTLAHRAYRGQDTPADIDRLMDFYQSGGMQTALERILASPKFIFRAERDSTPGIHRITDLELASRLSFFLWSSIPDDELLDLATSNKLHEPATLDHQVHRMLADPKAEALVTNFAGQWLYLRNLRTMIPNSVDFPDFDDNLRQAFYRETALFFGSIMREDRNVLDLMTADYTFINERLARHYKIPNIYGTQFRRVTITDENRRGLLGQGSILMVSSHTDRTSPVVRGKWILDNLLGTPPPPMPANVPPLNENANPAGRVLTMRERMETHRDNPVCAGCHQIMDPIGFSLENFDATGAWRDREGGTLGTPIDASGQLLDGTKINGPVELRKALVKQPEIFIGTMTEKLMIYALGRGLTAPDMPEIRSITRGDTHFSSLILGIVHSPQFQLRNGEANVSN